MSRCVTVTGPPASICALNFGTTEPLDASTLPKRTEIMRVALVPWRPNSLSSASQYISASRLVAPSTETGSIALSVEIMTMAAAPAAAAMVMISTDKAIEPVSVLGATKRLAEMYCEALDKELGRHGTSATRMISVRFGNVLASNGSVVPKFKAQIEAGGPVTVTHPDMVRYFMTIREACDLVITAATHALGPDRGDVSVYVLNMGQPVRIVDLAERIIRLSGLEPGRDIKITFTGIRPGERLHEILFAREEEMTDIGIPGIVAAKPVRPSLEAIRGWVATLEQGVARNERAAIFDVLRDAVPEFRGEAA